MIRLIRKHAGVCYIILMTAAIGIVLLCADDPGEIWRMLGELDVRWAVASGACIAMYLFLRVVTLRFYLNRQGYKISWRDAAAVSGAGQFYSAITPSASGGQPMQVLYLHRRGIPVSVGTACISAKFIGFQLAVLILGSVLWLLNPQIVVQQLHGFRWFVVLGFVINGGLLGIIVLTVWKLRALEWIVEKLTGAAVRMHILRDGQGVIRKARETLNDYRQAMLSLTGRPTGFVVLLVLSFLQVAFYMGVSVCIYHAFDCFGSTAGEIMTLQCLLFIAAAFIPLPGAAGAQESGFVLFFRDVIPAGTITVSMLCWRFFTYYLLLIAGAVMMALGMLKGRREM